MNQCRLDFGACVCFHFVGFCCLPAVSKTVFFGGERGSIGTDVGVSQVDSSVFFFQVIGFNLEEEQDLKKH